MKTLWRWGMVVWCMFFVSGVALAQEESPTAQEGKNPVEPKTILVASVGISDITVQSQQDNTLKIVFDISNEERVQPDIIYSVKLFRMDEKGTVTVADQKVYIEDVLSLSPGQTIHREITYVAPRYLQGSYLVGMEARNRSGMVLSDTSAIEPIALAGSANSPVSVDPQQCFLSIDGESNARAYLPEQGVDVLPGEVLRVHCPIVNHTETDQNITPVFSTYTRSIFGKTLGMEKQAPLTIISGRRLVFETVLPRPINEPQAYEVKLDFVDDKGEVLMTPVQFHYVVRGEGATIQNISLDKQAYRKGDMAEVTIQWSGSAHHFPDARLGVTDDQVSGVIGTVGIMSVDGMVCAKGIDQQLGDVTQGGQSVFRVAITKDCSHPEIAVVLADASGKVLASENYDASPRLAPKTEVDTESEGGSWKSLAKYALYVFGCIPLLIVIFVLFRRFRRMPLGVLIFGVIGSGLIGMVSSPSVALAATSKTFNTSWQEWVGERLETFENFGTISVNSQSIPVGGTIRASSSDIHGTCSNGRSYDSNLYTVNASTNGTTKDVENSSKNFTVSTTPQNTRVLFERTLGILSSHQDSARIDYTVVGAATTPPTLVPIIAPAPLCGTANGHIFQPAESVWNMNVYTMCTNSSLYGSSSGVTYPVAMPASATADMAHCNAGEGGYFKVLAPQSSVDSHGRACMQLFVGPEPWSPFQEGSMSLRGKPTHLTMVDKSNCTQNSQLNHQSGSSYFWLEGASWLLSDRVTLGAGISYSNDSISYIIVQRDNAPGLELLAQDHSLPLFRACQFGQHSSCDGDILAQGMYHIDGSNDPRECRALQTPAPGATTTWQCTYNYYDPAVNISGSIQPTPTTCSASRAVGGACNATTTATTVAEAPLYNLCASGNASVVTTNLTNYTWACTGTPCAAPREQYLTLCDEYDTPITAETVESPNRVLKGGTKSRRAWYGPQQNTCNAGGNIDVTSAATWTPTLNIALSGSAPKTVQFNVFKRSDPNSGNITVQYGGKTAKEFFTVGCEDTAVCGSPEQLRNACKNTPYKVTNTWCDNREDTCNGGLRDCSGGYREVAP